MDHPTIEQTTSETATVPTAEIETTKPKKQKKPKNKKKKKKVIIWSVVLLLVAGYIGYSIYAVSNYIPSVKAGEVSYQSINSYLSTTATISSSDSKAYFAPPQSKAIDVNFKVGDVVKAGDMIASFDLTDLENQIRLSQISYADAKLSHENAKINFDEVNNGEADRQEEIDELTLEIQQYNSRIRKLRENNGGYPTPGEEGYEAYTRYQQKLTQAEIERDALDAQKTSEADLSKAKNALTSAANAMESASINIASLQKYQKDKGIIAEFDGIVTELNLVAGGMATNTTTACVIQTTDNLKADFKIGKYDVGTVKLGQTVTLSLGDLKYEGKVTKIGAAAIKGMNASGNATSAQVPAEITISNPDSNLIIGLDFDAEIETFSNGNALAVPVEAVLTDRNGDFCYKLIASEKSGVYTYEKIYITTGNASDVYIEVLSGINEGDQVVLNPPTTIEMLPVVKVDAPEQAVSATESTASAA
ncbi:efflux RND transporter periplasmic adaptor subunit [Hydrogenoanaerobacterium sp.]|uniref:efflux RND transporter periplasmic adaptor subunit n=1 Tax=Hydrogenoanaerobacterium sp. TaxID=2953763 RepID=UPI002898419C|nr:efflux RND transporter periplasmic adaptor subunit [Hydrogenoanaerobacterium sp.]